MLVTDVAYPVVAIGQLYRDRADCENGFDELKNQWGLSGFTMQDINRCQTTAGACALVVSVWPRHIESAGMQCEDGVHQQMRWTPWKKSNARHGANTLLS